MLSPLLLQALLRHLQQLQALCTLDRLFHQFLGNSFSTLNRAALLKWLICLPSSFGCHCLHDDLFSNVTLSLILLKSCSVLALMYTAIISFKTPSRSSWV